MCRVCRLLGVDNLDGLDAELHASALCLGVEVGVDEVVAADFYGGCGVAHVVGAVVCVAGHDDAGDFLHAGKDHLVVLVDAEASGLLVVLRGVGLSVAVEGEGGAVAELHRPGVLCVLIAER